MELVRQIKSTEFTVSVLPEEHLDYPAFAIIVKYQGDQRWAVIHGNRCLGPGGLVVPLPVPSSRREWREHRRFSEPEAIRLAAEWALTVRVNGKTAAEVLEAKNDNRRQS